MNPAWPDSLLQGSNIDCSYIAGMRIERGSCSNSYSVLCKRESLIPITNY